MVDADMDAGVPIRFHALPTPRKDRWVGRVTGQALQMRRGHFELVHRTMLECGDYARLRLFLWDALLISSPVGAHVVLQSEASQYSKQTYGFRQVARVLGQGLFTAEGPHWKDNRVVLQPFFTRATLDAYTEKMVRHSRALAAGLRTGEVDLAPEMVRLTLTILGDCIFDEDFGRYVPLMTTEFVTLLEYLDKRVNDHLPLFGATTRADERRFEASLQRFDRAIGELIGKTLARPASQTSVIHALASNENTRDPRNLRDQVITLMFAGHETSAVALQWVLYLLAANPDWRARVEAELDASDGFSLPILRSVIHESLRLYPPVWILPRRIDQNVVIDGREIRKGTMILVSPFAIHRNPRHWDRPDVFDPERFSEANVAAREKGLFLPFGMGKRACVAANMAMQELTVVLATLLRALRFDAVPGHTPEIEASLTLRPRGGMPLVCSRRGP